MEFILSARYPLSTAWKAEQLEESTMSNFPPQDSVYAKKRQSFKWIIAGAAAAAHLLCSELLCVSPLPVPCRYASFCDSRHRVTLRDTRPLSTVSAARGCQQPRFSLSTTRRSGWGLSAFLKYRFIHGYNLVDGHPFTPPCTRLTSLRILYLLRRSADRRSKISRL